jgi:hypothetical protein
VKVKANELRSVAATLTTFATFLATNADQIARRANDDADDGVRGISYDNSRAAPGHSDPVAARVGRDRWDPVHNREDLFVMGLRELMQSVKWSERQGHAFLPLPVLEAHKKAVEAKREAGVGDCSVCGHFCAGTVIVDGRKIQDRLRAGRCDACRKYRERNGKDRPRERWIETDTSDGPTEAYWAGMEEAS